MLKPQRSTAGLCISYVPAFMMCDQVHLKVELNCNFCVCICSNVQCFLEKIETCPELLGIQHVQDRIDGYRKAFEVNCWEANQSTREDKKPNKTLHPRLNFGFAKNNVLCLVLSEKRQEDTIMMAIVSETAMQSCTEEEFPTAVSGLETEFETQSWRLTFEQQLLCL